MFMMKNIQFLHYFLSSLEFMRVKI